MPELPEWLVGQTVTGTFCPTDAATAAQPARRAALENCYGKVPVATIHYVLLQLLLPRAWQSAPLNYQCSLVKIINAILQIEKSTAESATETFRPSELITRFPRIVLNLKNSSRAVQDTNSSSGKKMIPLL